jgi:hypothetical protein
MMVERLAIFKIWKMFSVTELDLKIEVNTISDVRKKMMEAGGTEELNRDAILFWYKVNRDGLLKKDVVVHFCKDGAIVSGNKYLQ